jgi:hypothetical protein
MDTSLHSHIIGIHIQERIERAAAERLARDAREPRAPRLRFRRRRRTAPAPVHRMGAGPA